MPKIAITDDREFNIWTIQMGKWRLAKARQIRLLDITAKSGVPAFAPQMSAVMEYKRGEISEEEYTQIYLKRMEDSLVDNPGVWQRLKNHNTVALACYCRAGVFCHRHLFSDLMVDYLTENGYKAHKRGELVV